MAYRPAKVHVSSKKKKKNRCTRPGMNFYFEHCSKLLVLQTLKAETLAALPQLYQCRTLSKPLKTLIHKIDTIGVFYGLLSTKPENSRPRCAATHGHKFKVTCGFLIQICVNLRSILPKKMPPLDPSAHDLQNPKIASPKKLPYAPPRATIDLR